MTLVVVDASVAGRWILPDERGKDAEAMALRERLLEGFDTGYVPTHFRDEVFSLLFQAFRDERRLLRPDREQALAILAEVPFLPVRSDVPDTLHAHALDLGIAQGLRRNGLDLLYLALADLIGATLWTADSRFARQLTSPRPPVRLLPPLS